MSGVVRVYGGRCGLGYKGLYGVKGLGSRVQG